MSDDIIQEYSFKMMQLEAAELDLGLSNAELQAKFEELKNAEPTGLTNETDFVLANAIIDARIDATIALEDGVLLSPDIADATEYAKGATEALVFDKATNLVGGFDLGNATALTQAEIEATKPELGGFSVT